MPRYKFAWENLPATALKQLAHELDLGNGDASEALRSRARPTEDFVLDAWEPLRESWLARDPKALDATVKALWRPGQRDGYRPPTTAEEQFDWLRRRNNAPRLREVVLAQFIAAGEAPAATDGAVAPGLTPHGPRALGPPQL